MSLACAAAMFILIPPAVFLPLMYSTIQNIVFDDGERVMKCLYGTNGEVGIAIRSSRGSCEKFDYQERDQS